MKKNKIKGLSAFELLGDLDDEMILSATLPEAAPAVTPAIKKRSPFMTFMNSGWAAAIVAAVVALAVLLGAVLVWPFGVIDPPDTDPSHGIHGTEAAPDTNDIGVIPPLTETPEQEKGNVAVVSDGITVYPKGYCVYLSEMRRDENGDLTGLDADGTGAVYQLAEIWDELPTLRTAGNGYELPLPDHMTLRNIRVFEMISLGYGKAFEEIALSAKGTDPAIDLLNTLTGKGDYIVVLDIYSEINYSEDEYAKSLYEYAFMLEKDPNLDITFPVRMLIDGQTHYLEGKDGINSGHALTELAPSVRTATVTRETDVDFYLSPQGTLQSVTAYDGSFRLMMTEPDLEPLVSLPAWAEGDYYFVFTVSFPFESSSLTRDYPFHIKLVEKTEQETEEESTPAGDVGETPLPPRVTVGTNFGGLAFGNTSHSDEYHEGYMLWTEQWYDGGMVSGDGPGATGQLSDISAELPVLRHNAGEEPYLWVYEKEDTLTRIYVYRDDHSFYFDAEAAPILASLPVGRYIVVLRVETQGDYIEEAEAYERTCTEYAFWLDVVEAPETKSYILVTGGGQQVEFEAEKDGFLAWREGDLNHIKGAAIASVIFADDDAMRALPDMEITYGTPLNLSPREADDALYEVILYSAKGEMIAGSNSLSVVNSLENDGWDKHVILVLQIMSQISETERVCYEYAIDLTITQP